MCKCISTQPLDQAARLRILRQCCWSANESLVNWPGWLRIPTPAAWSLSPVDVYVESVLDVPVTPCALPLTAMIQHCFKVSPPQGCSYQVYQGRRTASHPNKFKLLVSWGQPPPDPTFKSARKPLCLTGKGTASEENLICFAPEWKDPGMLILKKVSKRLCKNQIPMQITFLLQPTTTSPGTPSLRR